MSVTPERQITIVLNWKHCKPCFSKGPHLDHRGQVTYRSQSLIETHWTFISVFFHLLGDCLLSTITIWIQFAGRVLELIEEPHLNLTSFSKRDWMPYFPIKTKAGKTEINSYHKQRGRLLFCRLRIWGHFLLRWFFQSWNFQHTYFFGSMLFKNSTLFWKQPIISPKKRVPKMTHSLGVFWCFFVHHLFVSHLKVCIANRLLGFSGAFVPGIFVGKSWQWSCWEVLSRAINLGSQDGRSCFVCK